MIGTPIVVLDQVAKAYGDGSSPEAVLSDVHLCLLPGQKASLVGPSGCGKSTLLLLVAGLLRPDAGTISVDGVETSGLDDRARARIRADRIGIALQADNLIPFLSARENIEVALGFASGAGRGALSAAGAKRARALELLERFGVAHRAGHRPRHLSGGEAQRVALAVSVANDPGLLLADEVVAALDEETATGVIDDLLAADLAVLYVTHDVDLADRAEHRYEVIDRAVVPR